MRLELAVWREVAKNLEIEPFVRRTTALLAQRLPLDALLVRRLNADQLRVETIAVACAGTERVVDAGNVACSNAELRNLSAWCRAGEVAAATVPTESSPLATLAPKGARGPALAGPLLSNGKPAGAVVLLFAASSAPSASHRQLLEVLLEPLGVALENDARIKALGRLREAAEADKRALLTRLERQDIVETVVGSEEGLRNVMERVEQVAPTDAPVLLLGETGSGKEIVARAIHAHSRRAKGAMVRVNCGAIPAELIDSELFGHERGSFTGAVSTRMGWFERADGGTLFLDEVAELLPAAQVRLLRVLQDGVLERVGADKETRVDVRILAATNQPLEAMVNKGAFRRDLWYRLGVFPIRIPPLRARTTDIPALAAHFAERAGRRLSGQPLAPTPSDLELLVAYPWPGNVRELAAVIERAAILGDGRRLEVAGALGIAPPAMGQKLPSLRDGAARTTTVPPPAAEVAPISEAMAQHIERALERTLGRVEGPFGAAALLGINPHTLRSRMKRLGVEWKKFRRG